ncbi:hypothetical protein KIW84_021674 [Lathyrus oleraceus]|uniref:O-methyltransferase C-terminal domain-containing protein n=1 Tax=Pisum sativum TaxID=3888 RepID=A0A9D4Y8G4_PEA|nr:hypothetical protein KIW84_021674 [Pisum sativum]
MFNGLESLVDVGGGTGNHGKGLCQLECFVFDLPLVVDGLQGGENLNYVGGDMFEKIPPTDAILLKWILHDWNDEECIKILKKLPAGKERNKKEWIELIFSASFSDYKITPVLGLRSVIEIYP